MSEKSSVTFEDVEAAAERLRGIAHRTPVFTSRTFDERFGGRYFFKCENLQRAGAFKFRGAYNALSLVDAQTRERGVLTYSSGNHAQALALAGRLLGVRTTVIMPDDAPRVKLEATRGYGAEVITYDRAEISREELGKRLSAERGLPIIPPYDHPDIVAGQGTVAMELIAQVGGILEEEAAREATARKVTSREKAAAGRPTLDALLVCCGGGGLLSGSAVASKALQPACRVIGVEPARADDATRSFRTKQLHTVHNPDTIADGARTPSLGAVTFPLVLEHVDDMTTASEEAIVRAMHFIWQRMKLVVEPTGALAAAALFDDRPLLDDLPVDLTSVDEPSDRPTESRERPRVGIILSGGNVEIARAAALFESTSLE